VWEEGKCLQALVGKRERRSPLGSSSGRKKYNIKIDLNTLWTGDADLRLYITTVKDG